jgi:hypothetical protein
LRGARESRVERIIRRKITPLEKILKSKFFKNRVRFSVCSGFGQPEITNYWGAPLDLRGFWIPSELVFFWMKKSGAWGLFWCTCLLTMMHLLIVFYLLFILLKFDWKSKLWIMQNYKNFFLLFLHKFGWVMGDGLFLLRIFLEVCGRFFGVLFVGEKQQRRCA